MGLCFMIYIKHYKQRKLKLEVQLLLFDDDKCLFTSVTVCFMLISIKT
jgi:hypothetical protein